METKEFQKYLEKRLDKSEIASIEEQAIIEVKNYEKSARAAHESS